MGVIASENGPTERRQPKRWNIPRNEQPPTHQNLRNQTTQTTPFYTSNETPGGNIQKYERAKLYMDKRRCRLRLRYARGTYHSDKKSIVYHLATEQWKIPLAKPSVHTSHRPSLELVTSGNIRLRKCANTPKWNNNKWMAGNNWIQFPTLKQNKKLP